MTKGNASSRKASGSSDGKNVVRSLAKGFRILEAFSAHDAEMTLTQIATRTNLDAGTTFRLINTLVLTGYLNQVAGAKRYRLGLKVLDLGFTAIGSMELRHGSRHVLRSLVDNIVQTASLDVLDGSEIVRIDRVFKNVNKFTDNSGLGSRMPAAGSVIGNAIIAYLPAAQLNDVLALSESGRVADMADLTTKLADIRTLGYAHRRGLNQDHLIAAPCLDDEGYPRAAISIACSNSVCSEEAFIKHGAKRLVQACNTLGRLFSVSGSLQNAKMNKRRPTKP